MTSGAPHFRPLRIWPIAGASGGSLSGKMKIGSLSTVTRSTTRSTPSTDPTARRNAGPTTELHLARRATLQSATHLKTAPINLNAPLKNFTNPEEMIQLHLAG
mgnify:CR=1 FL=1